MWTGVHKVTHSAKAFVTQCCNTTWLGTAQATLCKIAFPYQHKCVYRKYCGGSMTCKTAKSENIKLDPHFCIKMQKWPNVNQCNKNILVTGLICIHFDHICGFCTLRNSFVWASWRTHCNACTAVGIVNGYRLDGWSSSPDKGKIILLSTLLTSVPSHMVKWPAHSTSTEVDLNLDSPYIFIIT